MAQKALNYGVLGIAVLIILALILSLFSDSDNFTTAVYVLGTTLASLTIIEKAVKYANQRVGNALMGRLGLGGGEDF